MSVLQILPSLPDAAPPGAHIRLADLGHLAVLEAHGADTLDFLQGQLTQDIKALDSANARLAGYCTAKGRMLASGIIWKAAPGQEDPAPRVRFMVDASLAAALQKRLSMFVMRSKVKIEAGALRVVGVTASGAALLALESAVGALPRDAWLRADLSSGSWIAAPAADGQSRWWWVGAEDQLRAGVASLPASAALSAPGEWLAADVAAGLPWITATTQDLFVPQTVNFELVGGISFTKGCYPGQEIVARSHYLGKLKRRMFFGSIPAAAANAAELPAADIYHDNDAQPCGRIVNAVLEQDKISLLFESTLASAQGGALHVAAPDGPVLTLQPLPYSLPGDKQA